MATLEKAVALAASAHAGQKDKEGHCYILHPLRVMMRQTDDTARIVAVLHDVLEDTAITEDDLKRAGFSDDVLLALRLLTHRPEEPYADYVIRCSGNPLASRVKVADLADNSRLDRALLRPDRLESDLKRMHRYQLSYKFLMGQLDEKAYREAMITFT